MTLIMLLLSQGHFINFTSETHADKVSTELSNLFSNGRNISFWKALGWYNPLVSA